MFQKYFEVMEYEQVSRNGKIPAGRFGECVERGEGRGIQML